MNELLVLALLMHWPLHAYKIAGMANNILGPEEQISRGTLSLLLVKLEREGLITDADPAQIVFPSERPSRALTITPAGRQRFAQLMLDTTSHPSFFRRLFHLKALHLEFLPLEQQVFLVEQYLNTCLSLIRDKEQEMQAFAASPDKREHMRSLFRERAQAYMRFKIEQWRLEVAWVQSLRAELLAGLSPEQVIPNLAASAQSDDG
jgi:DNA-binding PadR family transcriptional regulator